MTPEEFKKRADALNRKHLVEFMTFAFTYMAPDGEMKEERIGETLAALEGHVGSLMKTALSSIILNTSDITISDLKEKGIQPELEDSCRALSTGLIGNLLADFAKTTFFDPRAFAKVPDDFLKVKKDDNQPFPENVPEV